MESGVKAHVASINFTKPLYLEDVGPRKIKSLRFSTMSGQEIAKSAEVQVYESSLYQLPERKPHSAGVLDTRLGTSNKHGQCATCLGKLADCPGHFGVISLALPVFHIGYLKDIIVILQCICKKCAHILLEDEEKHKWLRRMRNPNAESVQKKNYLKKVNELCKKVKTCPKCGEVNGVVKKWGSTLKIVHDKYKNYEAMGEITRNLDEAIKLNKDIKAHAKNVLEDLHPAKVLSLFEQIVYEDCEVLDLVDRPEQLIVTHLNVPPVAIRPSVEMDSAIGSNEDDITIKLMQIVQHNNQIRVLLEGGLEISKCMELWDFLQLQLAMYINSELPGIPPSLQTGRPLRGFVQRLKGKQGRIRGNLSGKRVDFSARTVISPDPNLKVTEVAVPLLMALTLTYPEKVSPQNIEKLRQRVINGKDKYPGANFVIFPTGVKRFLKFGDRRRIAAELKIGDVVERHLEDGDIVLFNRQPSLHRMSIMCHRVRVKPWRTLRFNESVCNPYNADFDGDEMNMHVPQTEEARAEALMLMGVQSNLCTPKNGEILVAATQDFLTSAFLITRRDMFYDRAQFAQMCTYMNDGLEYIDLPTPAVFKPKELWTGKQIFDVLIRPNAKYKVFVNLVVCEKTYKKGSFTLCPNDGFVYFKNSELICGQLGKCTLGNGSKDGLFTVLLRDYGPEAATTCMNRLAKLSARWIGNHGFSIGIDDVQPGARLIAEKEKRIVEGYQACDKHIQLYNKGQLTLQPGCDAAQTLESEITGELNNIREVAGQVCMKELHWRNSPLTMSQCGSKGSATNISQMVACVGQQSVNGRRAPNGFIDRSLPHFPKNDKSPQAKGFVANSFYTGLTATEFFFHTMAGREGLVDTAVKTAETGYMSRRLIKALEDLSCQYDGTVRTSSGSIVQFVYGDDNMDPVHMEGQNGEPLNLSRMLMKTKATCPRRGAPGLLPVDILRAVETRLSLPDCSETECSKAFRSSVRNFVKLEVENISNTRTKLGLPLDALVAGSPCENVAADISGMSARQMEVFLDTICNRYQSKKLQPGTAVGAIGAQSIGEPGTQMTLKTFHFAGVASMNITLGVPRIKEIINASKNPSTPIITAKLVSEQDIRAARIVKGRIEKTALGDVAKSIKIVLLPGQAYVSVKLNMDTIYNLQLDIKAERVVEAILNFPKIKSMKLKPQHVKAVDYRTIAVSTPESDRRKLLFALHALQNTLPKVIVMGIPTVERAVINKEKGKYNLLVEGSNLAAVMGTEGVDGTQTTSNSIMEVQEVLGIEAARGCIIKEIQYTMSSHGMSIDQRHMMLLADVMTYKGEVLGITRFGLAKMKESALMLASFEKTTDHLFSASVRGRTDQIEGVSECIIMGNPMPVGTGMFKVRQNVQCPPILDYEPEPIFS